MDRSNNLRQPKARALRLVIGGAVMLCAAVVFAACRPVQAPATGAATGAASSGAAQTAAATDSAAATDTVTTTAGSAAVAMVGDPKRGGYIFAATTGCGCHFNKDLNAPAGGNKFEGPFGVVYASNITSDPETGLGQWTDQQIVDAMRLGKRPDGSMLFPIMPYHDWSHLADQDAYDLAAAMRQIPPVKNAVPKNELKDPVPPFTPAEPPLAVAPTEGVERGKYLAALGRCAGCHTPKDEKGQPDLTKLFGGAAFGDNIAPNLTPDEMSGLGKISDEEIIHFLMTGEYGDGSTAKNPMAGIVKNGTSKLTDGDRAAIVAYLRSLPPVSEKPAKP